MATLMERDKIKYYLPLVERIRIWSDRKKKVMMPLFNGYIFVKPKARQRDQVLTLPGVVKYLRYNGEDARVTDMELDLVRELIKRGYDVSELLDQEEIFPGEKIMITQGPLKHYKGELLRIESDSYALIGFEKFGHSLKVKLPKQIIKKIV